MRKKTLVMLLSLVLPFSLLISSCKSPGESVNTKSQTYPPSGFRVGNLAPYFSLVDLDGNTVRLSDYAGKPVLINFWATWCGPCRLEMPFLQEVYDEYKDSELIILAVNIQETSERVKEFMTVNQLTIPVLIDKTGQVSDNYAVGSIPTTLFLDKDGVIKQRISGAFPNKDILKRELLRIIP